MNTPDVNTVSAAEHTVGIMLALARNISIGHRIKYGEWNRHSLVGTELRNKTIGLLGWERLAGGNGPLFIIWHAHFGL
ncbi:MAG: hypothetical protein CM1200mP10_19020 [Candidatus Neomarinimicrobiota bacterium]|nr:MAG: hypothetical protein CM1200mP10_19020 [Candidatus Neomarinimicrobiota bacterium]